MAKYHARVFQVRGLLYVGAVLLAALILLNRSSVRNRCAALCRNHTQEVQILGSMHHPHIVLLIGACMDESLPSLVYELAEGEFLFAPVGAA